MPPDRSSRRLDRSQLPDGFTPESIRAMGVRTARHLARHDNGILTPAEQAQFDAALREALQRSTDRLGRSFGKAQRVGSSPVDPDLRRHYLRTQRRLDEQAQRARRSFPQLTDGWDVDPATSPPSVGGDAPSAATVADHVDETDDVDGNDDDVSIATFEDEIEQTSDTLEILEQIAAIQRQQLEHQRSQLLSETRGVFFALAVSVAVIVSGIAPLVEASPDDRRLILVWTVGVCAIAGLVYAGVRALQSRSE